MSADVFDCQISSVSVRFTRGTRFMFVNDSPAGANAVGRRAVRSDTVEKPDFMRDARRRPL